jgi:hypothetical protein
MRLLTVSSTVKSELHLGAALCCHAQVKQARIETGVLLETQSNKMLLYIPKNQLSVNV